MRAAARRTDFPHPAALTTAPQQFFARCRYPPAPFDVIVEGAPGVFTDSKEHTVKYMLVMRQKSTAQDTSADTDMESMINAMGKFNEAMMSAGVLAGGGVLDEA